jgi:hypothetical protein
MKQTLLTLATVFCLTTFATFGQTPIDVAEQTFKLGGLGGEEVFYFGFAEGDQIVFNFEEVNGKGLKEIEIVEYPSSSKFMDYKTAKVTNKIINVTNGGIYKFRFSNSAVAGRVCKIKIQRIPENEDAAKFNCSVFWSSVSDTAWVTKTRQILVRVDTVYDEISSIENQIWLNSRGHSSCLSNGSTCTKQKMKLNYHPDTEEIYMYIIADQKTAEAFNNLAKTITKAGMKAGTAAATSGTSLLVGMFTDKATDAAVDNLPAANSGNKIDIYFTDKANADKWYVDYDNRIGTYDGLAFKGYVVLKQRLIKSQIPKNEMYLCLKNNNAMTGIPVYVNIVAKRLVKVHKDEQYQDPKVTTYKVPYLKNRAN